MTINRIKDDVREERKQGAELWLKQLIREFPYKDRQKNVLMPVLDIYRIIYENVLKEQYQYNPTSHEFLKREAIAERLAKLIDALNPQSTLEQTREKMDTESMEMHQHAKDALDKYQTIAIEAGLSGINLGDDFAHALNNLQDIVHPPERRKEQEGRINI